MPAAATRSRKQPAALPCRVCPTEHAGETDLVIHLVEDHGALWTSTNSFSLDDLVIPAPREAEETPVAEDTGWFSRLLHRSG